MVNYIKTNPIFYKNNKNGWWSLRYLKSILIISLALYALPVLGYIIFGTLGAHGANDFHAFWYSGQFILEGLDPYQSLFSGIQLPMRQPGMEIRPSNSPPLQLVLTLYSLLPWTAAKLSWLVTNFFLAYLCFYLVERCLPFSGISLDRPTRILILLIFFDLSPTRIAIENGQTTLLVFALMLMSLLVSKRSWFLAGCLLGLALSKVSVSISVALFFLYHRNFRILVTAVFFQILGFAIIALISGNSIILVFTEYFRLFISLADQRGIHLAALMEGSQLAVVLPIVMTLTIAVYLYIWLIRDKAFENMDARVVDFHLLALLTLWSLLVAYHRLYDALLVLFLIVLFFKSNYQVNIWGLSSRIRAVLAWGFAIGLALMIIPAPIVDMIIPGALGPLKTSIPTVILLIFLPALMFLFHRSLSRTVYFVS